MSASTEDARRRAEVSRLFSEFAPKFPDAPEITAEALLRAFSARDGTYARGSKPVVVVDVRTDAETRVSVIRGALTKRAFEARLDAGDFATHAVVAYCTIGYRSAQYVEKLRKEHADLLARAHKMSTVDRAKSDALVAQAAEVEAKLVALQSEKS